MDRLLRCVGWLVWVIAACVPVSLAGAQPVTTFFTYQGQLTTNGAPANGTFDMAFSLFDAPTGGTRIGGAINCQDNVQVTNGLFTVQLGFGVALDGTPRYLEMSVRADATVGNCGLGGPTFTTLSPRQQLTQAPYAGFATFARAANSLNAADGSPSAVVNVDAFGSVGVGTTVPTAKLHVQQGVAGVSLDTGLAAFESNGDAFIRIAMPAANQAGIIFTQPFPNQYAGGILYNNSLVPGGLEFFCTGNTTRMVIGGDGRVGIGQDFYTPGAQMDVRGDVRSGGTNSGFISENPNNSGGIVLLNWLNDTARIRVGGNGVGSNNGLDIQTINNNSRIRVLENGNVGIDQPAPTAHLEIGGVAGTDGVKFPDGTLQVTAYQRLKVSVAQSSVIINPGVSNFNITVTGAAAGDVAIVCLRNALTSGIIMTQTRVSANTVTYTLDNTNSAATLLGANTADVVVLK